MLTVAVEHQPQQRWPGSNEGPISAGDTSCCKGCVGPGEGHLFCCCSLSSGNLGVGVYLGLWDAITCPAPRARTQTIHHVQCHLHKATDLATLCNTRGREVEVRGELLSRRTPTKKRLFVSCCHASDPLLSQPPHPRNCRHRRRRPCRCLWLKQGWSTTLGFKKAASRWPLTAVGKHNPVRS